jgi:hypothetical protein
MRPSRGLPPPSPFDTPSPNSDWAVRVQEQLRKGDMETNGLRNESQVMDPQMASETVQPEPNKGGLVRETVRDLGAAGCLAIVLLGSGLVGLFAIPLQAYLSDGSSSYLGQAVISMGVGLAGVLLLAAVSGRLARRRRSQALPGGVGRKWNVQATLGPLASHGGLRNWDLYLADDGIVAAPVGVGPTLAAGLAWGLGDAEGMQEITAEQVPALTDTGDPKWRRYLTDELRAVVVKKPRVGYSEIRITRQGVRKPDVYGIVCDDNTDAYRNALERLYGDMYDEQGF